MASNTRSRGPRGARRGSAIHPTLAELKARGYVTFEEMLKEHLEDPEFREEWERTALARTVAHRLIAHRIAHHLSQTQLARVLGMKQPAVSRLESGDVNPTLETLMRLAEKLDIEFVVGIVPPGRRGMLGKLDRATDIHRVRSVRGQMIVAVR